MAVVVGEKGKISTYAFTSNWTYDAAGRLSTETYPAAVQPPSETQVEMTTVQRTYDAENHTLVSTMTGWPTQTNQMQWGPNGHPTLIGGYISGEQLQYETLHWDGDQLLFTTNSQAKLDDIKVGTQGDILPLDSGYNGLTFYDRDPSGGVMGCHNATGATFAGVADTYTRAMEGTKVGGTTYPQSPCSLNSIVVNKVGSSASMPISIMWWGNTWWTSGDIQLEYAPYPVGNGGIIGMPRTDGLADGLDIIQGVRGFDSSAGTWTTPDAYAGTVSGPTTQKSYIWNNNDPIAYSDPSGFIVGIASQELDWVPTALDASPTFQMMWQTISVADIGYIYVLSHPIDPTSSGSFVGVTTKSGEYLRINLIIVEPGMPDYYTMAVFAHETAHGYLYQTLGSATYNELAKESDLCASGQPSCNDIEILVQRLQNKVLSQLGLPPVNGTNGFGYTEAADTGDSSVGGGDTAKNEDELNQGDDSYAEEIPQDTYVPDPEGDSEFYDANTEQPL